MLPASFLLRCATFRCHDYADFYLRLLIFIYHAYFHAAYIITMPPLFSLLLHFICLPCVSMPISFADFYYFAAAAFFIDAAICCAIIISPLRHFLLRLIFHFFSDF